MRLNLFLLFMTLAIVPGCFCLELLTPGIPPPGEQPVVDMEEPRTDCLSEKLDVGFVLDAGSPALVEGTSEVPISPAGCFTWRRVVTNGVLVESSFRHLTGQYLSGQDGGLFWGRNVVTVPMLIASRADGLTANFDLDEDGVPDEVLEESWSGEVLQRSVRTQRDPSGVVTRRTELQPAGTGAVHYRHDELVDGAMQTLADFDARAVQAQTASCYASSENTATADQNPFDCTPEHLELIRARLNESLKDFHDCMSNLQGPLGDQLRLLELRLTGEYLRMPVRCFSSKRVMAAVDISRRTPVLYVNRDMLGGGSTTCESAGFIRSTLGHEMLHLTRRFAHDPALESLYERGAISLQQLEMSDQIYGCEALCTSSATLNRCSCARCLRTKACDNRCAGLDSCVVRQPQPDGGLEVITSEAVGALCGGQWFRSMAACQLGCSASGGCKSLRMSCDKSCQ